MQIRSGIPEPGPSRLPVYEEQAPNMNGDHSSFQSGLRLETSTAAEAGLRFSDRRLPLLRGIFFSGAHDRSRAGAGGD